MKKLGKYTSFTHKSSMKTPAQPKVLSEVEGWTISYVKSPSAVAQFIARSKKAFSLSDYLPKRELKFANTRSSGIYSAPGRSSGIYSAPGRSSGIYSAPTIQPSSNLTISQAAKLLGLSPDTLRNWEASSKLVPARTKGGARRYSEEQLKEVLANRNPVLAQFIARPTVERKISEQSSSTALNFANTIVTILNLAHTISYQINSSISNVAELLFPARPALARAAQIGLTMVGIVTIVGTGLGLARPGVIAQFIAARPTEREISEQSSSNVDNRVLQAATSRNTSLNLNVPLHIKGTLTVNGDVVITGDVTAPNLINQILEGDNIEITNASGPNPTITATIPSNLVTSLQSKTGALKLEAGTGISISGLEISSGLDLSAARSIGGCSGCITMADIAAVGVAKGGLGLSSTTFVVGDILYASTTDTLSKLAIGSANQILKVSSGGIPGWSSSIGSGAIAANSVDFTQLKDSLTLDADTSLAFSIYNLTFNNNSSSNFVVNLSSTGDFVVQDNGTAAVTFSDTGTVAFAGALTANSTLLPTVGATLSGGTISLNASSNNTTNINTGTSSGALTIGGGLGTVAVNSTSWDISSAGAASGLTGVTSSGTITFSDLTTGVVTNTSGTLSQDAALDETRGGISITSYTTGDILYASGANTLSKLAIGGTGNVLNVSAGLPAWTGSLGGSVISANSLDFTEFADALTLDANTSISLLNGSNSYSLTLNNDGTSNLVLNLSGTGDFAVQDASDPFMTLTDAGAVIFNDLASGIVRSTSGLLSSSSTPLTLAEGGTNAALTADAGSILYSGAAALALSAAGSSGNCLLSGGSGAPTWGACGISAGSSTTNQIVKFTSSTTVGDSSVSDDGTTITLAANKNLSSSGATTVTQAYSSTATAFTVTTSSTPTASLLLNDTNSSATENLLVLQSGGSPTYVINELGQVTLSPTSTTPIANISNSQTPISAGTTGSYATLTNLPATRLYHSSVAYNGYLFVTGGSSVSTVYSAQIKADGTIGAWATLTNLPAVRYYHSSVAYNGYLFVTGGHTGTADVSTVYSAPIKSDGTIGSFATLTTLPVTLRYNSSVAYNGYLFVTGGETGGAAVSTVYSAQIKSDGTIGAWATLTNLPATRYAHSSVAYNGYLFVTGGSSVSTVYSAQIKSDGTIGAFATLTNLPATRAYHSSVAYNGYLFVTGGYFAGGVSTVYSAQIKADGTIGAFATLTNLPAGRAYHSSVAYNGYLFVTGGYASDPVSTVYSAPLQSTALAVNASTSFATGNLFDLWNDEVSKFSVDYSGLVSTNAGISFSNISNKPTANLISSVDPLGAGATGAYSTLTNLPATLYAHSSVAYNGYLFVTGGASTVYSAQIKADGTIGAWATLTNLPATFSYHSSVAYNGYLFVIGGNAFGSTVYSAPIKSDGTIGSWASLTNLPQTLSYHSSVAYSGYIFVLGGQGGDSWVKSTVYSAKINPDGTIGTWATLTNLPAVRYRHSSVVYNGYLFVIGGAVDGSGFLNTVYSSPIKPDGTIGSFATLSTLPVSLGNFSAAVYNGYIFVTGGQTGVTILSTVYSAAINSDGTIGAWATLSTMPQAKSLHSSAIYDGYLFVTGGNNGGVLFSTVYSAPLQSTALAANTTNQFNSGNLLDLWNFNQSKFAIDYSGLVKTQAGIEFSNSGINSARPQANLISAADPIGAGATGAYSTLANLPAARYYHSSVTYNGYLFVTGGYSGSAVVSTVYSAPIKADGTIGSWATLTNLPAIRNYHSSVAYNGYLFVTGGHNGTAAVSTVYSAKINADGTIGSFATLTNLPATLYFHSSVAYNGYLFVTGGYTGSATVSTVYSAQINADGTIGSFATLTNLPAIRYGLSSVVYNGYLFVTGGFETATVSTVYSAQIKSDGTIGSFATLTNLPAIRNYHSSVAYNGYLFVTGGHNGSAAVSTVYSAQINADGTIGSFATLTNLPGIRDFHSSVAYNGYLFVTGGFDGSAISTVYSTPLQSTAFAMNTSNTFSAGNLLDIWNNNTSKFSIDYDGNVQTQGSFVSNVTQQLDGLTGSYSTLSNLPAVNTQGGVVTYNGYMYIVGGATGNDATPVNTIYSTPIRNDGTISATFNTLNTLPATTMRLGAVAANGYLYSLGGHNGTNSITTVSYAQLKPDGTIGTVGSTTALPLLRSRHAPTEAGGYIFVLGGNNDTAAVAKVYSSKIQADGTLAAWATLTDLPAASQSLAATSWGGYLFVSGGYDGTTNRLSTVYSAPVLSDGTIGAWSTLTSLPALREQHKMVAYNGYLYVVGGSADGSTALSTVYSAPIKSDGTIGSWATLTALPAVRYQQGVALYNGYVFVVGGNSGAAAVSTVYSASLTTSRAFVFNTTNTFSTPLGGSSSLFTLQNNGDARFNVDAQGNGRFSGNIYAAGAILGTPGAVGDLAENIEASDTSIEAGDVVSICNPLTSSNSPLTSSNCRAGTLVKSSTAYDSTVLGVVSTQASLTFSPETENGRPVALAGRVPVKVSTENGSIAPGDFLTASSTPGVAMKMTQPGQAIGKALEAFDTSGKILILVYTQYANPTGRALVNLGTPNLITSLESKLEKLEARISGINSAPEEAQTKSLLLQSSKVPQSGFLLQEEPNALLITDSLSAQSASFGELALTGSLKLGDLMISSDPLTAQTNLTSLTPISLNGLSIDSSGNVSVKGSVTAENVKFTSLGNKNLASGENLVTPSGRNKNLASGENLVTPSGRNKNLASGENLVTPSDRNSGIHSASFSGTITVLSGQTEVIIENELVKSGSKVILTSSTPTPVSVKKIEQDGKFVITLPEEAKEDTKVHWVILN